MKKRWTELREQNRNKRHADASLAQRLRWKSWKRATREHSEHLGPDLYRPVKARRSPVIFTAPYLLSLVEAPDLSIKFYHDLQKFNKQRDVFVDLARVTKITPDAIALLLSIVIRIGRVQGVQISGNYPDASSATETIRESGFDQYLRSSLPTPRALRGAIVKRDFLVDAKRAEGYQAQKLIDFAAKDGGGLLRLKAAYGHLLECMANTHEHAGRGLIGSESWWASVFKDTERQCDCLTFIDMGVGIFESIELNLRLRLFNLVGAFRPNILRDLLEGRIPSSTKVAYRGRGLPSIYDSVVKSRTTSRLMIITNDVYADVQGSRFVQLSHSLEGLLLYWEVPYGPS